MVGSDHNTVAQRLTRTVYNKLRSISFDDEHRLVAFDDFQNAITQAALTVDGIVAAVQFQVAHVIFSPHPVRFAQQTGHGLAAEYFHRQLSAGPTQIQSAHRLCKYMPIKIRSAVFCLLLECGNTLRSLLEVNRAVIRPNAHQLGVDCHPTELGLVHPRQNFHVRRMKFESRPTESVADRVEQNARRTRLANTRKKKQMTIVIKKKRQICEGNERDDTLIILIRQSRQSRWACSDDLLKGL